MDARPFENPPRSYWENLFTTRQGWGAYPPEELVRFMARNFTDVESRGRVRVLEIGCGPGPNLWYLAREGYRVAGIDFSSTALEMARARLEAELLPTDTDRLDLRAGNFSSLPWADQTFDAVVEVAALYANPMVEIQKTIAEIYRCLKPGGLFFGKLFGDQTTGYNSGVEIELGTRRNPDRGPCAGNDIAHFFCRAELDDLFTDFSSLNVDYVLRTDQSGEINIFHWLVTAQK